MKSEKIIMEKPYSPTKIDNLCEKFLDAKMRGGKTVEIFVNPSKRDIKYARDAEGAYSKNIRFIADGNTKKMYIWNAALELHAGMLDFLQQEGHVARNVRLYNDPDVISGEWNTSDQVELYYNANWGPEEMGNVIMDGDWSWINKKTGFKTFEHEFIKEIAKQLGSKADPKILKAVGMA
jgi:hypothetical protein